MTIVLKRAETRKRGSGGRPTREEALRREELMLSSATQLFIERGFDATSMDAVAEAAGVSKPTLYARYADKRALFAAVLRSRIEAWLAPVSAAAEAHAKEAGPKDLPSALDELSAALLASSRQPGAAALKRCIAAQALHFPELARLAHEEGWLRAVRAVAVLLERFAKSGEVSLADPDLAAELFLNLLLGGSSRLALYGIDVDVKSQEQRRRAAIDLFLNGIRGAA